MAMTNTGSIQWTGAGESCNDAFSFWKLPEDWRSELGYTINASAAVAEWYLFERYLRASARRPPSSLHPYYLAKRFIPRRTRHRLQATFVKHRLPAFPRWPIETGLMVFWRDWLNSVLDHLGVDDAEHIGFWPDYNECCVVLTHDVESSEGIERIEGMADLEQKYGFRSAWNVPLAQYEFDWTRFERLRARGFEVGAHGLCHDGRLFRSEADFSRLRPKLEALAREHQLRGFRSPSTLRRLEWVAAMDFDYDSSFADTDVYEAQPGGSCSIFPFFIGRMVELPYTLPQDHTLINLLKCGDPTKLWFRKIEWIAATGGMILVLVHPDYIWDPKYRWAYEELLKRLCELRSAWRALPTEVAAWWRRRDRLRLVTRDNRLEIAGGDSTDARVRLVSSEPLLRGESFWRAL